jgi:RHS repeat-associated protein
MPERSLASPTYALIDLHGTGLPDVLDASRDSHRVWQNLGRLRFGSPPQPIASAPTGVSLADDGVQLADMEGNGSADLLVTIPGSTGGYYRNRFDGEWMSFQGYAEAPSFNLEDPNVALVDIDGDRRIDVFATLPEAFLVIRNLGRDGWASPRVVPRSQDLAEFPDVVLGAPDGRVRLANLSGDDLLDLVVVYDGRIDYWPSLGHGNFGPRVTMARSPRLSQDLVPEQLFFSDLDGDGFADLVLVEADRVRLWINQSGNGWSDEIVIAATPMPAPGGVRLADMRGTGTAGVLWTYEWGPTRPQNYLYLDFTGGTKPHLLAEIDNRLGAQTSIVYRPSTEFMIDDLEASSPWRTRLPFPVQVVSEIHVLDTTTGHHGASRYVYHHGRYDGDEREFVGFGRVDIYDRAEDARSGGSAASLTKSWYHLGDGTSLADEYFPLAEAPGWPVPKSWAADSARAVRGSLLRSEVYGLDGSAAAEHPYRIVDSYYDVVPLSGAPGIWFAKRTRLQTTHLERGSLGPRVDVRRYRYDDELAGGRISGNIILEERQTLGRADVNPSDPNEPLHRRLQAAPLSLFTITYYAPTAPGVAIQDRPAQVLQVAGPLTRAEEDALVAWVGGPQANPALAPPIPVSRIIKRELSYYDGDDFFGLGHPERPPTAGRVTHGQLTSVLSLAASDALLNAAYGADAAAARARWRSPAAGYRFGALYGTGLYWVPIRRVAFLRNSNGTPRYGLVRAQRDSWDRESTSSFDTYALFTTQVVDAADYPISATYDYLVPGIRERTDANGNVVWAAYDALGRLERLARLGKVLARDAVGVPSAAGGDTPTHPSARYEYRLNEVPTRTIAWERVARATGGPDLESDYLITHEFHDGLGRPLQRRTSAAPGPLDPVIPASPLLDPRWAVSSWEELTEKGQVARRYQPVFAASADFAIEPHMLATPPTDFGYDAVGRLVESRFPDGTRAKAAYGAWETTSWDANDLIGDLAPGDPRYGSLLPLLAGHTDTPTTEHIDGWGRIVARTGHNGRDNAGQLVLLTAVFEQDLTGQIVRVHDPRGLVVHEASFDLLSQPLRTKYVAGGATRKLVHDAGGNLIWRRDGRGTTVGFEYDAVGRLTRVTEETGAGPVLREHRAYRPYAAADVAAHVSNLFGPVEVIRTGATRMSFTYDHRGLVTTSTVNLWADVWNAWQDPNSDLWTPGRPRFDPPAPTDDSRGRAAVPGLPGGFVQTRTYDALGRAKTLTQPDGRQVRWEHTLGNQVSHVEVNDGTSTLAVVEDADYGPDDRLLSLEYGNGVVTHYTHDPATRGLASLVSRQAGGTPIQSLAYQYDPVGNIWQITDNLADMIINGQQIISNTRRFEYDPLYRLVRARGREHRQASALKWTFATRQSGPQAYRPYDHRFAYDQAGNLTRNDDYGFPGITYDGARPDLFLGGGAEAGNFTYDAEGNLTRSPRQQALGWDYAGQLAYADRGGGGRVRCFYLPNGQRLLKLVRRSPGLLLATVYLGDGFELRFRRSGGTLHQRATVLVRGGTALLAELAVGDLGANQPAILFVHPDHLGSACLLTLGTGAVFSQEEYYAFGGTSDRRYGRSRYRHAAKERDETGLVYYGARYYDPAIGRWISADPVGLKAGLNLYVFVRNNPLRYQDPRGLFEWGEFFKSLAIGFAVGLVVGLAAIAVAVTWPVTVPFLIGAGIVGLVATTAVAVQAARGRDLFNNPISDTEQARRLGGILGGVLGGGVAGGISSGFGGAGGAGASALVGAGAGEPGVSGALIAGLGGRGGAGVAGVAIPEAVEGAAPWVGGLGITMVYTPESGSTSTTMQMASSRPFTTRPGTGGTNEVRETSSGGRDYQINSGHGYRQHRTGPLSDPSRAGLRDAVEEAIISAIENWLNAGNTAPKLGGGGSIPRTDTVTIGGVTIEFTFGAKPDGTIVISDYWALP